MLGVVSIAIDAVTGTVVLEVIVRAAWQMVQLQFVSFDFISSRKEQYYKESRMFLRAYATILLPSIVYICITYNLVLITMLCACNKISPFTEMYF